MGPSTRGSQQPNHTPSPRRRQHHPSKHRPNHPLISSPTTTNATTNRRTLSKSVTDFFTKLRPSRRPERGGTARPTTDDEHDNSPRCRSRSLDRYHPGGSDTIPANLWNMPTSPTPQPQTTPIHAPSPLPHPPGDRSRALFLAKREHRQQRRTLLSSGDFLGVTGVNPYTGTPDIVTPPTSSSSAITSTTTDHHPTFSSDNNSQDGSHLLEYPGWELGSLVATPVDLSRLTEDCRTPTGRVVELGDSDPSEGRLLSGHLANYTRRGQAIPLSTPAKNAVRGRSPRALPFAYTPTTTTTGSEHDRPTWYLTGAPRSAATGGGSSDTRLTRRVWTAGAVGAPSRPTSPPCPTAKAGGGCSGRPDSPSNMQLSVWRRPDSGGSVPQTWAAPTWGREGEGSTQVNGPCPMEGGRERQREAGADSDTTSPSRRDKKTKKDKRSQPPEVAAENTRPPQLDRAMRKTMRKPPPETSTPREEGAASGRRSSRTSTRTSTSPRTPGQPFLGATTLTSRTWQDQAGTIVRGAARTAYTFSSGSSSSMDEQQTWPSLSSPERETRRPTTVSTRLSSRANGAKAAAKAGSAAGTAPGQGEGQGKGGDQGQGKGKGKGKSQEQGKEEQQPSKDKGNKANGKANGQADGGEQLEVVYWWRSAWVMLVRVVGAYWQVVSPVFDGESGVRQRMEKSQATWGDVVVVSLAGVFLFWVVAAGVWAVRGVVWVVRVLGELGGAMGVVAGLRD
ncbi:hypothetical protein C8A05DRAFT_19898 [Staphylotrichum tortipilum]|uniref:Uncharacterized protein n=1 Tax=Staphylotrichum tortipilum TaxID=2831512 RepID=A0AAN6MBX6_9PEZI|nr:hypothetical protein C8A05DRAFT_19898 [Staphylotrichum longicolle]